MRVAVIQMATGPDKADNLLRAERLVDEAARGGARLAVLPEVFNARGPTLEAEPPGGMTLEWAREQARRKSLWLHTGSFLVRRPEDGEKAGNTSYLVDPRGEVQAEYRKIHLFDIDLPGVSTRESDRMVGGTEPVLTRVDEVPLGMTICYDLRFPELYRLLALRGARMVAVPAAFTERTGRDHWEVLLRARAIENQVYMLAAGQIGPCPGHPTSYGRSMIVDPWGLVVAQAPDREGLALAELDFSAQDEIRQGLPCLSHRRPDVYSR